MIEFPDHIEFATDTQQFNNRYLFAVGTRGDGEGRLYFRPKNAIRTEDRIWRLVGKTGRPTSLNPFSHPGKIKRIHCDNDVVLVILEKGRVYRLLNTFEKDPSRFRWRRHYGWPFDEGPALDVERTYHDLCLSSSKKESTVFTVDPDGNRHYRFIDHIYALSYRDNLIHHNDPWTPGDWVYAFPMPMDGRFRPSPRGIRGIPAGMNVSAAVVAVIGPAGIYTLEYDFDIAGGNPLAVYLPAPQPHYDGIAEIVRFDKGSKPIRIPPRGWIKQPDIPGSHTANIQVCVQLDAEGNIVPGSDSRILRVLGLDGDRENGKAGYWEKNLRDSAWYFVEDPSFSIEEIRAHLIDDEIQLWTESTRRPYRETESAGRHPSFLASVSDFGIHDNFFDPAVLTIKLGAEKLAVPFYTHIQMRTSRIRRKFACRRPRKQADYLGGYLVFPEGESSPALEALKAYLGCPGAAFFKFLLRSRMGRIEFIVPRVGLNADIADFFNTLFGRVLFTFTE
jgi:hypothetical protein